MEVEASLFNSVDLRTVFSNTNTEQEDTDLRTVFSNTNTEPEDTDLRTEVNNLLNSNNVLQNNLYDVADRINKYKHRSEGIIAITLLTILIGVIIIVITFIVLPLIPIVSLFTGVCGGAVLVAGITILIVTLVFERVNKNKARVDGNQSISDYIDDIANIKNEPLRKKNVIKRYKRLTVRNIKNTLLPTLRHHRDVLISLYCK